MRELEFLPDDYIRARYHRRIGFIRSWLLLALGLAMVLWSLQMGKWVQDARAELQALRGTGYAAGVDVEKVEKLQAEQRGYERRLSVLQRFGPTGSVASLVAVLADLVPDEVVLEEASLSGSEAAPGSPALRVAGWSPSEVLVTRTLGALEASPSLEGALLVESKPGANGNADRRYFVITVKAVDVPQPEENPGGTSPERRKRLAVDRQQLLILLVAAVMSGSFFLLVLWPKQKELSALASAVERERVFVKQKVRTSREGVYVTVRVASLRKAGGALLRRVPAEPELASFLEQVARCVASDPLVRHEVERIEAEPPKGTPATPIRLRLAGPFEAVYRCLGTIEGLERLTWFRRLEIRRADEEGGVAAEVEILVYYLPASQDEELTGGEGQTSEVAAG